MNLHDWIDELVDVLELDDVEVDEALVLDLARVAAHNVQRPAAPISTYLLGYAAATHRAKPDRVEELAAAASQLAESWDKPAAAEADDYDDDVPDDSSVDHTGESLDD